MATAGGKASKGAEKQDKEDPGKRFARGGFGIASLVPFACKQLARSALLTGALSRKPPPNPPRALRGLRARYAAG